MSSTKKRQEKKLLPARKHRRTLWKIYFAAGCALLSLCVVGVLLFLRTGQRLTVCTISGHPVTQAELQYSYIEQIAGYQDKIGRFGEGTASGPDFSRPLAEQSCPLVSGISWREYFMNAALRQLKVQIAGAQRAEREGFTGGESAEQAVKLRLEAIETAAEEAGLSTQQYLRRRYGAQVTMELIGEIERRNTLSTRYLSSSVWECPISEEEVESRFSENRRWNMTASYLVVPLDCTIDEREQALAVLAESGGQEDFFSRCADYCQTFPEERAVLHTDAAAGEMEDYTVSEWILDETRQPGDATVVSLYDELTNRSSLSALYFIQAQRNHRETYTYQEMLLTPDTVEIGSEPLYWGAKRPDQLELSQLDEESFGTMALAYSPLASAGRLGVQTSDAGGLSGLPYAEWVMDQERNPGEIRAFETDYGFYLIRYMGPGSIGWRNNIENDLRSEAERALSRELEESAEIQKGFFFSWLTK